MGVLGGSEVVVRRAIALATARGRLEHAWTMADSLKLFLELAGRGGEGAALMTDLARHVEYIHYNPVKHGFVNAPKDWEYSSFHQYVADGRCDRDWGVTEEPRLPQGTGRE